jgi:hypothetical protein
MALRFLLLCSLAFSTLRGQNLQPFFNVGPAPETHPAHQALNHFGLFTADQASMEALRNGPKSTAVDLPDGYGNLFTAVLHEVNLFTANAILHTADGQTLNFDRGRHFQGRMPEAGNSMVSLSLFQSHMVVIYSYAGGNVVIAPLENPDGTLSANYVAYYDKDFKTAPPFECHTSEQDRIGSDDGLEMGNPRAMNDCREIGISMEASYKTFQDKGSDTANVQNFLIGFFNNVALLYSNESVNIKISEIRIWTSPDNIPTNSSSSALTSFGALRQNNFTGDLAHWVTTGNYGNGGIAWLDVLCANYNPNGNSGPYAYSNVSGSYASVPTYSWTVMVFAHETGHNVGSPHTHNCGWPGGAIDSCYTVEGNCYSGPAIARKGTVMSYCHLTNQGINLALGFGQYPGAKLRTEVSSGQSSCLGFLPGVNPNIGTNAPVCQGDTLILTTAGNPGTTYSWNGPGVPGGTQADTLVIPNVASNQQGNYTVVAATGNCNITNVIYAQVTAKPANPSIQEISNTYNLPVYPNAVYQWYDQNGPISGANQNVYIPVQDGQYHAIIQLDYCDFVLYSDTILETYFQLPQTENGPRFLAYPNPASQTAYLNFDSPFQGQVEWLDLSGRLCAQFSTTETQQLSMSVGHLAKGLYLVRIRSNQSNPQTIRWIR